MALSRAQQAYWEEVGRLCVRLERAADRPGDVKKLVTQLRSLVVEAQQSAEREDEHVRRNARRNPALVTFLNPPRRGDTFGRHVLAIVYEHNDDRELYAHGFGDREVDVRQRGSELVLTGIPRRTNVLAQALPDGAVLLRHKDGKRLWEEFDVD